MKAIFKVSVAAVILSFSGHAHAGWMQATKKNDPKCQFSFFLNMRPVKQVEPGRLQVSQDAIGFSGIGIVEMLGTADPDKVPIIGQGMLDIGVRLMRTEKGRDYWKECEIK